MKIESYAMSNNEVLRALRMFIDDKWDDGMFHLISIESILEDGETIVDYVKRHHHSVFDDKTYMEIDEFAWKFDNDWIVYVMTCDNEVCGLVAFSDWD